ncbi:MULTISPECIES: lysozyme [unclassified Enterococcus]|uniref:lysozyme n=1 Tax=unclassified Enterococcus TaxID=2608891 RepID=UPI001CE0814E|nr:MULTISPECIES: lysozyme [unclassified Enterococcus]MCA5011436.1 lysozyme [Enterococcus sp. S23]MCA5015122.1 lysozyme [Enterococcus sp. S22(2020)]
MVNEGMTISQKGVTLVKQFEGLRLTAYQDSAGVWTIGYGHTKGVYAGMSITQAQAEAFLKEDLLTHASGIFKYVKVQLNQNQFDALASFHFNLGPDILYNSPLLSYLNSQQWQAAATEMKRYVYSNGQILQGLVNRRAAEAALFLEAPFPSRPCKVKVGNIVLLSGGAKITSPWSSNEPIPANRVNQYYKVEEIHTLSSKWESSEYEVLISSNETSYRKWIYEQDLSLAPAAKFNVGLKVRLSTAATNASIHWSRRVLEKKYLGQEYTISQVAPTAESRSPYQYLISSPTLGNLWVLEQDLMDRTIWFITNEPFMNQGHNQNPEVKNGTLYKTIINDIPLESGAKSMAEFVRQNTWPMLTNGNVFLIEYPTHLMVKVVGIKPEWTDYMTSECLRLTKGQIPAYDQRDMKVVPQADKKYNWVEIDNLPKDWQAISNRLRGNLREKFCQYFLSTRVSYGKQSDGKFYLQIINIENNERAVELATKLKRWFPGDTNAYTNAQVFLQK